VSFQWHQPDFPPTQNAISVDTREPTARQFGGKYAQNAKYAKLLQHIQPFSALTTYLREFQPAYFPNGQA